MRRWSLALRCTRRSREELYEEGFAFVVRKQIPTLATPCRCNNSTRNATSIP